MWMFPMERWIFPAEAGTIWEFAWMSEILNERWEMSKSHIAARLLLVRLSKRKESDHDLNTCLLARSRWPPCRCCRWSWSSPRCGTSRRRAARRSPRWSRWAGGCTPPGDSDHNDDDNSDNDHDDNDDEDNNNDDDNGDDAPHPLVDVLRVELSEVWNAGKQDSSVRPANIFTLQHLHQNNCMVDLGNTENLNWKQSCVCPVTVCVILAPQVL